MTAREAQSWMLYGAYGFTGRLIAEAAVRRGHRPVLAGRDRVRLGDLAGRMGLKPIVADLDDPTRLRALVGAQPLVLNAAGPFSETSQALIKACLETATPYADVSGELRHIRSVVALDGRARAAGIALLTGAGFGVTFGDCLARHVADRLPDATHLRLSVAAANAQTTAAVRRTILGVISRGGFAVEGGRWMARPLAHALWRVSDEGEDHECVAAPMGELAALHAWAGAPNILVGRPMHHAQARRLRRLSPLIQAALKIGPLRAMLGRSRQEAVNTPGPEDGRRSRIWAEAWNGRGDRVSSRLETGEGYLATAAAAVVNVEALAASSLHGAFTPASAFGADHVLQIENVQRIDDPSPGLRRWVDPVQPE